MNKSTSIAYVDMQATLLLMFILLMFSLIQHLTVEKLKNGVEQKAEMIIEMTWPEKSAEDIDLWLLTPSGLRVGFNNKDQAIATLDRDDRGAWGDTYFDNGEMKTISLNKETIAIRGILPGKYHVNAHFYQRLGFSGPEAASPSEPVEIKAKITDINPRVTEVGSSKKALSAVGEQVTLFSFEVLPDGSVTQFDAQADLPFIK
jgi:hypothetical protein